MSQNALARLIEAARRASGESYAEIARRGQMPASTVHKLATTDLHTPPKKETLESLAKGLDLPVKVVTRAATEAAGYYVYEDTLPDSETQVLIANIEQLTPEQRASVTALVGHMLKSMP